MNRIAITVFVFSILIHISTSAGNASDEVKVCTTCHSKKMTGQHVHPAMEKGCIVCHTQHHSKDPSAHPKGLKTDAPELCWDCHDNSSFTKDHPHTPVATGKCTFCHEAHSSDIPQLLVNPTPQLCYDCHSKNKFKNKTVHPPVGGNSCAICHVTHSSDNEKLLTSDPTDFCFTCHKNEKFMKRNVHSPVKNGLCGFCHSPHATKNEFLLMQPINDGCLTCHARFAKSGIDPALKRLSFHGTINHPLKGTHDPLRKDRELSCTSCHDPHSSDWTRLFRYEANAGSALCAECHKEMKKYNKNK